MAMKHHPVVSSNIASAGYDPVTKTLEIKFATGKVYRYEGVPEEVYTGMWQAESVGKYVHQHIASSFKFKKVK